MNSLTVHQEFPAGRRSQSCFRALTPREFDEITRAGAPAHPDDRHGAKADQWFSHLAFVTPGEDVSNEWLEPVTDDIYAGLPKSNGGNA